MACELFRGNKKKQQKNTHTDLHQNIGKIKNRNSHKNRSSICAFGFYFSLVSTFRINFVFGVYAVCCIGLIFIPESHMLKFFELQNMVPMLVDFIPFLFPFPWILDCAIKIANARGPESLLVYSSRAFWRK